MSSSGDPTIHQSFLGFPRLNAPFVNEDRTIAFAWYRLLEGLFLRAGGSNIANPNTAYIGQSPTGAGAPLGVYSSTTGELLGVLYLQNTGGGPEQPEAPGPGPFVFAAARDGTMIVSSGEIEISRDLGVTWHQVSLTGGALPMLRNDQIRVSWTQVPPQITYLPIMF